MKFKKMLAVIMSIVMLLGYASSFASAEAEMNGEEVHINTRAASKTPYFEVSIPETVSYGYDLCVSFKICNANGFTNAAIAMTWDNTVLEYISNTDGDQFVSMSNLVDNTFIIAGTTVTAFDKDEFKLTTLRFKVIGDTGSTGKISMSVLDGDFSVEDENEPDGFRDVAVQTAENTFTVSRFDPHHDVEFNEDKTVLTKYPSDNPYAVYTIPDTVKTIGKDAFSGNIYLEELTISDSVTNIEDGAFSGCDNLKKIKASDNITSIGNNAFNGCHNLKEFKIPNNVITIGDSAFYDCSELQETKLPDSLTSIGNKAFYGCGNLYDIIIPNGVTSIGDYAFFYCGLNTVVIPAGVNSIGIYAIDGYVTVDENNPVYSSVDGYLFNKDKKVLLMGDPKDNYEDICSYKIPDTVNAIGIGAFYNSNLEKVIIPNSVTEICDAAFFGCDSLSEVTIPGSVTEIGDKAFGFCTTGVYHDRNGDGKVDNFVIKCEKNSAAHNYAYNNGFAIEFIDPSVSIVPMDPTKPSEPPAPIAPADTPYFEIAMPDKFIEGQEVNIDFNLKNASKFTSGTGHITYDNKVLEFIEIVKTAGETFQAGKVCIKDNAVGWAGAVETSFGEDICNLATVKFKVIGAGASRSSIEISVIDNDFFVDDTYCELAPIKADFTVESAAPSTEPSKPADPTTEPPKTTDPTTEPSKPTEPTTEPTQPTTEPTQPTTTPVQEETELKPVQGADIKVNNTAKTVTVLPKTTVDGFKKFVTNSANTVSIVSADDKELAADAALGTGAKVRVLGSDGKVLSEYEVIIPLDNNGDGKVNSSDARNALRNAAKLSTLNGVYSKASDFNGDGRVNSSDARTMLRVSAKLDVLKPEILDLMTR